MKQNENQKIAQTMKQDENKKENRIKKVFI